MLLDILCSLQSSEIKTQSLRRDSCKRLPISPPRRMQGSEFLKAHYRMCDERHLQNRGHAFYNQNHLGDDSNDPSPVAVHFASTV